VNERAMRDIVTLRLTVGFLGEREQFNWWATTFFNPAVDQFLEPAFSRTAGLAQYHAVVTAACRQHDEHLNTGCYHLFRLPEEAEHALHDAVREGDAQDALQTIRQGKEAGLKVLKTMAEGYSSASAGPVLIGTSDTIGTPKMLRTAAGIYFSAFTRGVQIFPYVVR
jgi:hypothetical protein